MLGAYLGAVDGIQTSALKPVVARIAASEAQHVAYLATIKGLMVALIFMNLRFDRRENGLIFSTSFLFLAIFIVLTGTDLFFRGDVYLKPGQLLATEAVVEQAKDGEWKRRRKLRLKGVDGRVRVFALQQK